MHPQDAGASTRQNNPTDDGLTKPDKPWNLRPGADQSIDEGGRQTTTLANTTSSHTRWIAIKNGTNDGAVNAPSSRAARDNLASARVQAASRRLTTRMPSFDCQAASTPKASPRNKPQRGVREQSSFSPPSRGTQETQKTFAFNAPKATKPSHSTTPTDQTRIPAGEP